MAILTDAQVLIEYQEARDFLVKAIGDGESYTEIEIRNRRWKAESTAKLLALIEAQIIYYGNRADIKAKKSRRLFGRLKR